MKLPHLDQVVDLQRGEAALLYRALQVLLRDTSHRPPMSMRQALCFAPLATLCKRLWSRHELEQRRPPKPGKRTPPTRLRISYDQLVAVRMQEAGVWGYVGLSELETLQLRVVLGKLQQKSLNLDRYIRFN